MHAAAKMLDDHFGLNRSEPIVECSRRGANPSGGRRLQFHDGQAQGLEIRVDPCRRRQTMLGIGTSFTEASAYVLAHLDIDERIEVMRRAFSDQGANFSMARTPIGSCDFSVTGRQSYADVPGDHDLACFSVDMDSDGFDRGAHPGIKAPAYDLLPMIREAIGIKREQEGAALRIVASAWTAPAWMKDIEDWYQPFDPVSGRAGTGGVLKPGHAETFAAYLVKYLQAYRSLGVEIWALTPVNEPLGNNGQWESMHFTAESQRDFIREHLGPALRHGGFADTRLLVYDHNRQGLQDWLDVVYADPDCSELAYGAAVHWYDSTCKVYEEVLDAVHRRYPDHAIVHTEGCIDDLGNMAPPGIRDPSGFQESNWFDNDDFWWGENATDWAYSADWPGVRAEDHPKYAPVHRYARDIIVGMNHWVEGWIDWNLVLDRRGGPNHVGNHCGAPIMVDTATGQVYYTPVFDVLAQLSRSIRPGDQVVEVSIGNAEEAVDGLHATASIGADAMLAIQILNTSGETSRYGLQIGRQFAQGVIEADSLQTVRVRIPGLRA